MEGNRVQENGTKGPGNPKKKALLLGLGAAAVVVVGGYMGLCAWVGSSQTILKGVSVGGVPVGGMTREQAKSALEESMSKVSELEVSLEYGTWSGSIQGSTMSLDGEDCAQQAWKAGRSNFFLQGGAYLGSLMGMGQDVDLALDWSQEGQEQFNALLDEADQLAGGYHINPQTLLQLFLMQNGIITDTDNVECGVQLEDNEIEILRGLTGLDNSN